MAIPNITERDVIQALAYIDANGVPVKHKSTKYKLVADNGKKYPPKYVIAVADHVANGTEINTAGYNAVEAKNYLSSKGFTIDMTQETFELVITADSVTSTDESFSMDNLGLGDNYKPLATYYKRANSAVVYRHRNKYERKITNQTMPRLACQVFERQLAGLSAAEKESFPTCRYSFDGELYCGIFSTIADFKKRRNTIEYMTYGNDDGYLFVIYCWNIFSTIVFVQECLKRFGEPGDSFVLTYCEKDEKDAEEANDDTLAAEMIELQPGGYRSPYSQMLIESKNIIFRGAPGTGKSYLAKEIAADIISDGQVQKYTLLSEEQKAQVSFVQFHPSYDYSDFVEGLRPKVNNDGSIGFELQDGIFKRFADQARRNLENAGKNKKAAKKYIFIIDEINRGEISKIFGELFFAIEPDYRGPAGEIFTQYSNLHPNPNEKFYIPENVYIIGTMNDIDRSVDSFDFAMRRRFRFIEIKADDRLEMLDFLENESLKEEAERRMSALNQEILKVEGLNENYQIGAAYFRKLKTLSFDQLWSDYLKPLLQDYVHGMYDEESTMKAFENAYHNKGYNDEIG